MERVSHCFHVMSSVCLLKQRVAKLQHLKPGVILRCRIESSWPADRQTALFLDDTLSSPSLLGPRNHNPAVKVLPRPPLSWTMSSRGMSAKRIIFMFYVMHKRTDREDSKKDTNAWLNICGDIPCSLFASSTSHWPLISGIYVLWSNNSVGDIGHCMPGKLKQSKGLLLSHWKWNN